MRMSGTFVVVFALSGSARALTIETVPVSNPGNAPDLRYNNDGFGSVAYSYRIGKYEVTAGQYTEFLNAVARDDPNGLYNVAMGSRIVPYDYYGANIIRSGSAPDFSYSVASDWENRPVNFVSFWDAVRFTNWLHNGQPVGPQGPGTTEYGAYHNVGDQQHFGRNQGARYFIPSENEWYKAAYYKGGLANEYWSYPTASDSLPINTLPDTGNHANFFDHFNTGNSSFTIANPYYRTEVGAFANSPGPYGTFDQGGNVWEWNEDTISTSARVLRGGSFWFADNSNDLSAAVRNADDPTDESFGVGFRIACIPEPNASSTMAFYFIALCGFGRYR